MKRIEDLSDHYIICGHGRMGEILCQELRHEEVPFVVIEGESALAEQLGEAGYLVVVGDATQDEVEAAVGRAELKTADGSPFPVSLPSPATPIFNPSRPNR